MPAVWVFLEVASLGLHGSLGRRGWRLLGLLVGVLMFLWGEDYLLFFITVGGASVCRGLIKWQLLWGELSVEAGWKISWLRV